jgi:hypothetical protein
VALLFLVAGSHASPAFQYPIIFKFFKRSDATMSSEFRIRRISLDTWAVLLSLLAALLVRLGVLKVVPW